MKSARKDGIEILDVPQPAYGVAERRMKPFVRHTVNCAQFGILDLMKLACSAYLQGAYDAYEAIDRTSPGAGEP